MSQLRDGGFDRQTTPQREADLPVARQVAGGREDQISNAGQSHERLVTRTERHPETTHLRQPARDQCSSRVGTEFEGIADARGDGKHVLDRTADFDTDDVRR